MPTNERLARGDVEVSGRGKEARARVLGVAERLGPDERLAFTWLQIKGEAAQFRGPRGNRFERVGGRGVVDLMPTEYAEAARLALWRMRARIDRDQWNVLIYRAIFDDSEENVAIRLGLSRGQVSRRFVRGLQAVGAILRGRRS